jgi:hypothetical protein
METSATDSKKAVVFRMKYDHSPIPGTDPPSTEEQVYTDIFAENGSAGVAGLALDGDNGSGSSQRGAFSFSGLKIRKRIDPNMTIRRPMKKARPGQ